MAGSERFLEALKRKARLLAGAALATYESDQKTADWLLEPLAEWAEKAYGPSIFDDAIRGYAEYCMHVGKAFRVYEREGRYTPENLSEIVETVYEDDAVMVPYMWAAILIYPFWPSMIAHLRHFRAFVASVPQDGSVLELASGHGVFACLAATERPDLSVRGLDISPPAVAIANRIARAAGVEERVRFEIADALRLEAEQTADAVVAAMLAEHLEAPQTLFSAVASRLSETGQAFVSTALESPQRDHVFEFHRESEVVAMAEGAGLHVASMHSYGNPRREGQRFWPRALVMQLVRRD